MRLWTTFWIRKVINALIHTYVEVDAIRERADNRIKNNVSVCVVALTTKVLSKIHKKALT